MYPFSAILLTDGKVVVRSGTYKTSLTVTLLRFLSIETSTLPMPTLFSFSLFATVISLEFILKLLI